MYSTEQPTDRDPSGAYLLRHLRISTLIYTIVCIGVFGYLAATSGQPNRVEIFALTLAALFTSLVVVNPLGSRIIASEHRTGLMYAWTTVTLIFVGLSTYLDGGLSSPLIVLLFVALQYVSAAYPSRGVIGFSVAAPLLVVLLAVIQPASTSRAAAAMVTLVAATAGVMSVLAARNRESDRATQMSLTRQLDELASTDPLTGCVNLRRFDELLRTEVLCCAATGGDRCKGSTSLLLFDVDGFKSINDTLGHPAGDAALCALSTVLHQASRSTDTVARLGGDEFAVLLPSTGPGEATEMARRLAAAVSEISSPLPIAASVGIASVSCGTDPAEVPRVAEALICAADEELYRAKAEPLHTRPSGTLG